MIELIPELEFLIGPQPRFSTCPQDAQNRLHRMFDRFIGVFTRPERRWYCFSTICNGWIPQRWPAGASRQRIERTSSVAGGAYRDNEIGPAHPSCEYCRR